MNLAKADLASVTYICRNLRERDREELFANRWTDDPDELAIEAMTTWGAFSFVVSLDGVPIAALGASPSWPGVWVAWMMATDDFHKIGKRLTKWVRRVMIPSIVKAGAHRVEARSMAAHDEAHAWMRVLGAKRESVLRQYGRERQDFYLFVLEY
jgi:hypothetical protein